MFSGFRRLWRVTAGNISLKIDISTPVFSGVCFSFSDPSHLLRSFLFIKHVYITFLECISFLLVSKYIYNLLRICIFPSQIIRRVYLQFIYISFTIYEKDVASLYVHFKSGLYFQFSGQFMPHTGYECSLNSYL